MTHIPHTNTSRLLLLRQHLVELIEILAAVAFMFTNSVPGQALAFTDHIELTHQPLKFTRDPDLINKALVGIEAFPSASTAGELLNSPRSQIPRAAAPLAPGVAIRVLATAYSSTAGQTDADPFTTASGARVHAGTLAANFLPFGARVRIGSLTYTVEDRLHPRYNDRYIIDVWQPNEAAARQFGVRVVEIEIISLPPSQ